MTVERIYISPSYGGAQLERDRITVVAGAGIEGDRYFGVRDEPGQSITLIEAEEIEAFIREHDVDGDLSISRRNLVTRGVRLNELVGREFRIGEVRLRGVELCEPCEVLGEALASPQLAPAAIVRRFLHRAGLRADVLTGGVIARGAGVQVTG